MNISNRILNSRILDHLTLVVTFSVYVGLLSAWTSYEVESSQEQIATSSMFLQSQSREFMEQVAGISCGGFLRQK